MKKEIIIGIILGFSIFLFFSNRKQSINTTVKTPITPTSIVELDKPLDPNLINDVVVENLEIGDNKYSFSKGQITKNGDKNLTEEEKQKIRQLVFFYLETHEDPLFTSPDFDLEGFNFSIRLTEKRQKEYLNLVGQQNPFFPINTMNSLAKVFTAENKFTKDISFDNALNLLDSYKNTALQYKKDSQEFVSHLKKNENFIRDTNYIEINAFTTKDIFFEDLEKILVNSKEIEKEVTKREDCLKKGLNCQRLIYTLKEPDLSFSNPENFKILPLNTLFPSGEASSSYKIKGPFVANTPCFGFDNDLHSPNLPFYLKMGKISKDGFDNIELSRPKLATTNYYRKVEDLNIDKDLKESKAERAYQLETAYYLCSNLEYQPQLMTLYFFISQYKPLFPKLNKNSLDKTFLKEAKNLEEGFFTSKYPSYENLEKLSKAYIYAYKVYEKDDNLKIELLKRYLIIDRKLVNFNLLLNHAFTSSDFIFDLNKKDPSYFKSKENTYSYLYPFRSLWNLLYFPFSNSFWRNKDQLNYLEKKIIEEKDIKNKAYINYQEAVKLFGEEKVNK